MNDPITVFSFAHDRISQRDVEWVEWMVRLNLCIPCNQGLRMEPTYGQMGVPQHCGPRILALWRLIMFTLPVDLSNLMAYYDDEDWS